MNHHDKFVPQSVVLRDSPDVELCHRTIKSLEQENAQLKERLTLQLDSLAALQRKIKTMP
jgi:predicted nuclease with TOPRIM domain